MKFKDKMLDWSGGYINVFKGGSRRLITPIGDGYSDCILYQRGLEPQDGMEYLFEIDGDGGFKNFQNFLQLLPIPRVYRLPDGEKYERAIFDSFKDEGTITPCITRLGKNSIYRIDTEKIFKDEYDALRRHIVSTLVAHGYDEAIELQTTEINNEDDYVDEEYENFICPSYLKDAPKLYAQDGLETKKVYAKWFSSSMTWYLTELDAKTGRAFGYVKNEADDFCSEWGHFMVQDLINFKSNYARGIYVERDLHMGELYIDKDGKKVSPPNMREEAQLALDILKHGVSGFSGLTPYHIE